ncbi:MAG: AAA family ATPase, partial [Pseudomonadota bacterium]
MRFSRLRLNGFKSFVDPTDLIIADGLTGVVGPNGCGKSNLLEALRWVMGENRPTAMRGGGMEDVIFAGAATRPARNFAEVSLMIDNAERLAPAAFNDSDMLEVVRRITRDVGSAYKANTKDVRARDVQMLFADASTGAHSPALVRQGQISELINAKPKARRRILEEAAGISGLYQRRHEAELKLNAAEINLSRVDDVLDQLSGQLTTLARQAKQAARYSELGASLRQTEGILLYLRWKEAQDTLVHAKTILRDGTVNAAKAEIIVRETVKAREAAEGKLPTLREEEAVANAILQRLNVQKDTLIDDEKRAKDTITALQNRIHQLMADASREESLNTDATDTIDRLRAEAAELDTAGDGHADRLTQAQVAVTDANDVLQTQETTLTQMTEDMARLAARHQSAKRFYEDASRRLQKAETDQTKAQSDIQAAQETAQKAIQTYQTATDAQQTAEQDVNQAEDRLKQAGQTRSQAEQDETAARAEQAEAHGIAKALGAEVAALSKLMARDTSAATQILDQITVHPGLEKALGAALADDLKAPAITQDEHTGWAALAPYDQVPDFPRGVQAFADFVTGPTALTRRLAFIGLVSAVDGAIEQSGLHPGQRLISREGDLWRWDGYRAAAKDAPTAAGRRLEQKNRLAQLETDYQAAQINADVAQ